MLNKLKKSNNKGFTIIEVMIVLAIAGLILLIVLLAVPALQRNARNTTIKNDASALAAGIGEYESNNNGSAPTTLAQAGAKVTISGAANGANATAQVSANTSVATTAINNTKPNAFAASTLYVAKGKTCDGTDSTRSLAVYYYVEQSGTPSNTPLCIDAS